MIQLNTLLVTFTLVGGVHAADPLTTTTPLDAGAISYPESGAEVTQTLSRALIASSEPRAEIVMQTSRSWDGGTIAYPEGEAEITAVRISLPDGHQADFHCHPVPTFGYVVSGRLQVETRNGDTTEMQAGEFVTEVMNTVHRSTVLEGPAELLVFYAGAKGQKNTYNEGQPGDKPCG